MTYRIREVDGDDEDNAADLSLLHDLTFGSADPKADTSEGHWWLAYYEDQEAPVGFAGVIKSVFPNAGYYKRVGVLPAHRGAGLQLRFSRVIEARCRRNGWKTIYSDTTDNIPSANNFIKAGYRLFEPSYRWAFSGSLYWRKDLA